jgi:hypothetical protein
MVIAAGDSADSSRTWPIGRQTERMTMAKGQKRSGREPKKPKASKKKKGQPESGLNIQSNKGKPTGL